MYRLLHNRDEEKKKKKSTPSWICCEQNSTFSNLEHKLVQDVRWATKSEPIWAHFRLVQFALSKAERKGQIKGLWHSYSYYPPLVFTFSVAVAATVTEECESLRLVQKLLHTGTCVYSLCFGTMGLVLWTIGVGSPRGECLRTSVWHQERLMTSLRWEESEREDVCWRRGLLWCSDLSTQLTRITAKMTMIIFSSVNLIIITSDISFSHLTERNQHMFLQKYVSLETFFGFTRGSCNNKRGWGLCYVKRISFLRECLSAALR